MLTEQEDDRVFAWNTERFAELGLATSERKWFGRLGRKRLRGNLLKKAGRGAGE